MQPAKLILLLSLAFAGLNCSAQTDSAAPAPKQPLKLFSWGPPHSPTKASIYSAVIPGLGQVYNRKYWKLPLVYATFGTATWYMLDQRSKMRRLNDQFRRAYSLNADTIIDPNLLARRDNHRRMRDFSILAMTAVYALQIIDATVDAHFFSFNIDQQLSARVSPAPSRFCTLTYRF